MRTGRGLDTAFSSYDAAWVARRRAEGVEVIVQNCWTGGYANNARLLQIAESNLRAIREGGCIPVIYTNAAPWRSPQVWFNESVRNAGAELQHIHDRPKTPLFPDVYIDLEIADGDLYINPDDVLAFIGLWEGAGFTVGTYSADWYAGIWKLRVGDANRVNFGKPYWHARYDGIPDLAVNGPRHPLGPVVGKQTGWTDIEGVTVDLNVFAMPETEEEDMSKYEDEVRAAIPTLTDGEYVSDGYAIYYVARKGDVPELLRVDDSKAATIPGGLSGPRSVPLGVSMLLFHGGQVA